MARKLFVKIKNGAGWTRSASRVCRKNPLITALKFTQCKSLKKNIHSDLSFKVNLLIIYNDCSLFGNKIFDLCM